MIAQRLQDAVDFGAEPFLGGADAAANLLQQLAGDDALRGQLCVGSPADCAELLSRYAEAGCGRVYLWPLGDERRQIDRLAAEVLPEVEG